MQYANCINVNSGIFPLFFLRSFFMVNFKSCNIILKKIIIFCLALMISFLSVFEKKESHAIALLDDAIVVFFVLGCCSIAGITLATNEDSRKAVEDCLANTKENFDLIKAAAYDYYKIAILKTTSFLSDTKQRLAEIGAIQRSLVNTLVKLGYNAAVKPKIDDSLYTNVNVDVAENFAYRSMYFGFVDDFLTDINAAYKSFGGYKFVIDGVKQFKYRGKPGEYNYNVPLDGYNQHELYFERFGVYSLINNHQANFQHAGFYLPRSDAVLNMRDEEMAEPGSDSLNGSYQEIEDFYKAKAPLYYYQFSFFQPDSPNPMGHFGFFSLGAITQFTQGLHYWLTAYTFANRNLAMYTINPSSIALNKSLSPGKFQNFVNNYNSDIGMIKGQLNDILSEIASNKSYIDYLINNYNNLANLTDNLACEVTDLGLKVNSLPNALDYNNLYNSLNNKITDVNTNLRSMIDKLDVRVGNVENSYVDINTRVQALDVSVGNVNTRVKANSKSITNVKANLKTVTKSVADVNAKVDTISGSIVNAIAPLADFFTMPEEKDRVKVDFSRFKDISIPRKFPFSLPFDFYNILKMITADPVEPQFVQDISYKNIGNDQTFTYKLKINFNYIKPLIKPFKGFVFIIYLIGLIFVTKKILS